MSADACHKSLRALKAIYRVCSASCCNDSVTISGSSIGKWMSWSCRSSSGIGSTMPAVARHGFRESDCSRRAPWWPRLVAQRALRADASCPPGWACSRDSTPAGASPRSKATPRLTHLWVGLVASLALNDCSPLWFGDPTEDRPIADCRLKAVAGIDGGPTYSKVCGSSSDAYAAAGSATPDTFTYGHLECCHLEAGGLGASRTGSGPGSLLNRTRPPLART